MCMSKESCCFLERSSCSAQGSLMVAITETKVMQILHPGLFFPPHPSKYSCKYLLQFYFLALFTTSSVTVLKLREGV